MGGFRRNLQTALLVFTVASPLSAQGPEATDRPISLDGYEELWEIGGTEATGWDTFGSIRAVVFTLDGGLVVHDGQGMRVVVVDPEGKLVGEAGGRGEGPGEFQYIHAVLVGQNRGGFTVYDGFRQQFMRFSRTGVHMSSASVPERAMPWVRPHLTASSLAGEAFRAIPTGTGRSREIQRVTFRDGLETEHYYEAWRAVEQERRDGELIVVSNAATGEVEEVEAYFPQLRMDRLPGGGLLVVDSSAYEVKVVDSTGRLARILCRPINPAGVDRRARHAAQERARKAAEMNSGVPHLFKAVLSAIDDMRFFSEVPVISDLRAGWGGEVWVRRRGEDGLQTDGPIDVLSPKGTYVGTFGQGVFPLPDALGPNGLAAFVKRDDALGVSTVVVARLPLTVRDLEERLPAEGEPTQCGRDS